MHLVLDDAAALAMNLVHSTRENDSCTARRLAGESSLPALVRGNAAGFSDYPRAHKHTQTRQVILRLRGGSCCVAVKLTIGH